VRQRLRIILVLMIVLWLIEIADLALGLGLDRFGIRPRSKEGLWGILFAPFLHGGLAHLAANTIPLIVLGGLVLARGVTEFVEVTILVVVLGGLGTWLVADPGSVHVGASGVIFGYFGYLLFQGIHRRRAGPVAVAILVAVLYGGLLWGLLPHQPGVSWQGHLFGFMAGGIASWLMTRFGSGSTET